MAPGLILVCAERQRCGFGVFLRPLAGLFDFGGLPGVSLRCTSGYATFAAPRLDWLRGDRLCLRRCCFGDPSLAFRAPLAGCGTWVDNGELGGRSGLRLVPCRAGWGHG